MAEVFDPMKVGLEGQVLVEASAGTGKSFNVIRLLLRAVVENNFELKEILVVTFTKAAADELRRRVDEDLHALLAGFDSPSEFAPDLVDLLGPAEEHADRRKRVHDALLCLDELSVFTIHAFCERTINDYAFRIGYLPGTAVLGDEREILAEIIRDLWRVWQENDSCEIAEPLRALVVEGHDREGAVAALVDIVKEKSQRSGYRNFAAPSDTGLGLACEQKIYAERLERLREIAAAESVVIKEQLKDSKRAVNQFNKLEKWLAEPGNAPPGPWAARLADVGMAPGFEGFEFFDALDEVVQAADSLARTRKIMLGTLLKEVFHTVWKEFPVRKKQAGVVGYNDQIAVTAAALESDSGLARELAEAYPLVVVDEFQDTDPGQYAIFRAIHRAGTGHGLFLVGDPKQAIYRFRGGDLHTYLRAAGDSDRRYTLVTNWRASREMLRAVNRLYQENSNPFLFSEIDYEKLLFPTRERIFPRLLLKGREAAPVSIVEVPKPEQSENALAVAAALDIVDLLKRAQRGELRLERSDENAASPVRPGDIAVIVSTNWQGDTMVDELAKVGVAAVKRKNADVFEEDEASMLEVVMDAFLRPRSDSAIAAALVTPLIGYSIGEVLRLQQDAGEWDVIVARFGDYHDVWRKRGFLGAFRSLVARESLPERVLSFSSGERMLTNAFHLSELIDRREQEERLTPRATRRRFAESNATGEADEKELRLESDRDRVQIITNHSAKGLEWPFVFAPYVASARRNMRSSFVETIHEDGAEKPDLVLLPDEDRRKVAALEDYRDQLRLLYVLLTRASHRLSLYWLSGDPDKSISNRDVPSALYCLLLSESLLTVTDAPDIDEIKAHIKDITVESFRAVLQDIAGSSGKTIQLAKARVLDKTGEYVAGHETPETHLRSFVRPIDRRWAVTSYTGLISRRHDSDQELFHDGDEILDLIDTEEEETKREGMARLPKGALTGNLMHAIYERLDFATAEVSGSKVVTDCLRAFGQDPQWEPVITENMHATMARSLGDFRLGQIRMEDTLREWSFYQALAPVDRKKLAPVLARRGVIESEAALHFAPVEGFLRGYVDLIVRMDGRYYVLDYKSNYLGPTTDSYQVAALQHAMMAEHYQLQYHIYTVALDQWLRFRMGDSYRYDRNFGGVVYLFWRGITNGNSDTGVFVDRPDRECIEELSGILCGTRHSKGGVS